MLIEFKSIRSKSVNAKKIMYFYGYIREQTSFFLNTIKKLIRVLEKMVAHWIQSGRIIYLDIKSFDAAKTMYFYGYI